MKLTVFFLSCLAALCLAIPESEVDRILEEALEESNRWAGYNQTRHGYYKKRNHPLVQEHAIKAAAFSNAAKRLCDKFDLSLTDAEHRLMERASLRKEVNQGFQCMNATFSGTCNRNFPYRAYDGTCNNINFPMQGMPFRAFVRFNRVVPNYGNGVNTLRISTTGGPLLSPRIVSLIVTDDVDVSHPSATHQVVFFGQFLDHDLTSTPEFSPRQCCQNRGNLQECMAIDVPPNDDFYASQGIRCIDAQRSIPSCIAGFTGDREQMNQVTSYIDCSQIYGSSDTEMNALRNGRFLQTDTDNSTRLPKDFAVQNCGNPNNGNTCFRAGDDRVNENPGLTSMHTLFMREHNRIATSLKNINSNWNDDLIWEESRRINIAQMQQIVYSEYLPVVLGPTQMANFGITLPSPGSYSAYNQSVDATIINEFAAAAYRFGHTLIQNLFQLSNGASLLLETNFQNPLVFYQSAANVDRLLLGAIQQPCQNYDNFVAAAVTNHLFQQPNATAGSDLISLNIQRGRDHGIPGYNAYRVACGMSRITNKTSLAAAFGSNDRATRFMDAYNGTFEDIDLFPAGISETPISGGIVGPTFACIIGEQFKRLMFGDRFFFTHLGQVNSFKTAFLSNIRSRTLGSIMCDNQINGVVTSAPLNAFRLGAPMVSCANHPKLNVNGWFTAGAPTP